MLRWVQSFGREEAVEAETEQACPGMSRALRGILKRKEKPEVLDLGQHSRSAALYLAERGARVHIDDFQPPPAPPRDGERKPGGSKAPQPAVPPVAIRQPDRKFDLVLAWEHGDFVSPERLREFAAEVARVLAPGGWLVMYAQDDPGAPAGRQEQPACYRLTGEDRLVRTPSAGPARQRWVHPNRSLERALAPLTVQSIHLQRNRIREILVRKPEGVL